MFVMSTNTPTHAPDPTRALLENAEWLRRLARRLVRDDGEAEDVLQEAWIAARGTERPPGVPGATWLAGFVRNAARGRRRTEARRAVRERAAARDEATVSASRDVEQLEIHRALIERVEALPEAQRRMIVERYLEGRPPRRIAADHGIPVATVHSRIQRALQQLRLDLDDQHGDRRTWAAWILPVASGSRLSRASLVAGFVGAAALVGGVAAASVLWTGATPTERPTPSGPGSNDTDVAIAPLGEERRRPDVADVDASAVRSVATDDSIRVGVVRPDGSPASLVDVFALPLEEIVEHAVVARPMLRSSAALLHDHGLRFTTDADGFVDLDMQGPAFVWAGDERQAGEVEIASGANEATVSLEPSARLTVSVVDAHGAAIDDGWTVGFRTEAKWIGGEGQGLHERRALAGGHAFLQDVAKNVTYPTAEGADVRYRARLVHLDVPGCAETGRGAKKVRFRLNERREEPEAVELTVPPLGSLAFVVRDRDGTTSGVEGTVNLSFREGDATGDWPLDYAAELRKGIAVFPRFAVGAGEFRASISVPARGATWVVEDTGPAVEGERKRISTRVPNGVDFEVELVGSDGAPFASKDVYLAAGLSGHGGYRAGRQGRTDAEGKARFTIDEPDIALFPLRIESRVVNPNGTWQIAVARVDDAPMTAGGGYDLGRVELSFRSPRHVEGAVVTEDGDPVGGTWIHLFDRNGSGTMQETRSDGSFGYDGPVDGELTALVRTTDGFLETRTTFAEDDLDEPLRVVMRRASVLEVDIDVEPFELAPGAVQLYVIDANGEWAGSRHADEQGRARIGGLAPGTYDVEVRLRGAVALTTVEGVHVGADGPARDARLDAVRLRDLVRAIEVEVTGLPRRLMPQMRVDTIGETEPRSVHLTMQKEPYLVPIHLPCRLTFTGHDKAPVVVADSTTVDGPLKLAFEERGRVTLHVVGAIPKDRTIVLRGMPTSKAHRSSISFDPKELVDGRITVELPTAGSYRVALCERSMNAGGGLMLAAVPRPTEAVVDLEDGATAVVRVDAPYVE